MVRVGLEGHQLLASISSAVPWTLTPVVTDIKSGERWGGHHRRGDGTAACDPGRAAEALTPAAPGDTPGRESTAGGSAARAEIRRQRSGPGELRGLETVPGAGHSVCGRGVRDTLVRHPHGPVHVRVHTCTHTPTVYEQGLLLRAPVTCSVHHRHR